MIFIDQSIHLNSIHWKECGRREEKEKTSKEIIKLQYDQFMRKGFIVRQPIYNEVLSFRRQCPPLCFGERVPANYILVHFVVFLALPFLSSNFFIKIVVDR